MLNKLAFNELCNNHSNVYKLLIDASLNNEIATTNQNRFVIKCFFQVVHFTVIENWGYTQNSKDVIELISNCSGNELKSHLLSSPKNALLKSPVYVSKFIGLIDDYLKLPLLASLRDKRFAFTTDETTDITSIEQMAVYATFKHNNEKKRTFHCYLSRK